MGRTTTRSFPFLCDGVVPVPAASLIAWKTPPELTDAWARIDQANENYISLAREMNEFLHKYVEGMVKGLDHESGSYVVQLRHPKESNVTDAPRALIAQIVENLRPALDYMIFKLSVLSEPNFAAGRSPKRRWAASGDTGIWTRRAARSRRVRSSSSTTRARRATSHG